MLQTLERFVKEKVLDERTYFMFMEIKTASGSDFARMCLINVIRDMIVTMYRQRNLEYEYYTTGVAFYVERWVQNIILYQMPTIANGCPIYMFKHKSGSFAKRILFAAGDHAMNKLSDMPAAQMDAADLVCSLMGIKGKEGVMPLVFSDSDRFANLFELKDAA